MARTPCMLQARDKIIKSNKRSPVARDVSLGLAVGREERSRLGRSAPQPGENVKILLASHNLCFVAP